VRTGKEVLEEYPMRGKPISKIEGKIKEFEIMENDVWLIIRSGMLGKGNICERLLAFKLPRFYADAGRNAGAVSEIMTEYLVAVDAAGRGGARDRGDGSGDRYAGVCAVRAGCGGDWGDGGGKCLKF